MVANPLLPGTKPPAHRALKPDEVRFMFEAGDFGSVCDVPPTPLQRWLGCSPGPGPAMVTIVPETGPCRDSIGALNRLVSLCLGGDRAANPPRLSCEEVRVGVGSSFPFPFMSASSGAASKAAQHFGAPGSASTAEPKTVVLPRAESPAACTATAGALNRVLADRTDEESAVFRCVLGVYLDTCDCGTAVDGLNRAMRRLEYTGQYKCHGGAVTSNGPSSRQTAARLFAPPACVSASPGGFIGPERQATISIDHENTYDWVRRFNWVTTFTGTLIVTGSAQNNTAARLARVLGQLEKVDGTVRVQYTGSGLTSLDFLGALTCITGDLYIVGNAGLEGLEGLHDHVTVGNTMSVSGNRRMVQASLAPPGVANSLVVKGQTYVANNNKLAEFMSGTRATVSFGGDVSITSNPALEAVGDPQRIAFAPGTRLLLQGNRNLAAAAACVLTDRCRGARCTPQHGEDAPPFCRQPAACSNNIAGDLPECTSTYAGQCTVGGCSSLVQTMCPFMCGTCRNYECVDYRVVYSQSAVSPRPCSCGESCAACAMQSNLVEVADSAADVAVAAGGTGVFDAVPWKLFVAQPPVPPNTCSPGHITLQVELNNPTHGGVGDLSAVERRALALAALRLATTATAMTQRDIQQVVLQPEALALGRSPGGAGRGTGTVAINLLLKQGVGTQATRTAAHALGSLTPPGARLNFSDTSATIRRAEASFSASWTWRKGAGDVECAANFTGLSFQGFEGASFQSACSLASAGSRGDSCRYPADLEVCAIYAARNKWTHVSARPSAAWGLECAFWRGAPRAGAATLCGTAGAHVGDSGDDGHVRGTAPDDVVDVASSPHHAGALHMQIPAWSAAHDPPPGTAQAKAIVLAFPLVRWSTLAAGTSYHLAQLTLLHVTRRTQIPGRDIVRVTPRKRRAVGAMSSHWGGTEDSTEVYIALAPCSDGSVAADAVELLQRQVHADRTIMLGARAVVYDLVEHKAVSPPHPAATTTCVACGGGQYLLDGRCVSGQRCQSQGGELALGVAPASSSALTVAASLGACRVRGSDARKVQTGWVVPVDTAVPPQDVAGIAHVDVDALGPAAAKRPPPSCKDGDVHCHECSDGSSCRMCKHAWYLLPTNHSCVRRCPSGFAPKGQGLFRRRCDRLPALGLPAAAAVCIAKKHDCHICSGDATRCRVCKNSQYLSLDGGACISVCPPGLLHVGAGKFNRRCVQPTSAATSSAASTSTPTPPPRPCVAKKDNCHTCDKLRCTVCKNSAYLGPGGACSPTCPVDFWPDGAGRFGRRCVSIAMSAAEPRPPCVPHRGGCHLCSTEGRVFSIFTLQWTYSGGKCEVCQPSHTLHPKASCTKACPAGWREESGGMLVTNLGVVTDRGKRCVSMTAQERAAQDAAAAAAPWPKCVHGRDHCHSCKDDRRCAVCKNARYLSSLGKCRDACAPGSQPQGRGNFGRRCET